MDKGPPKYDPTEGSGRRVPKADTENQNVEIEHEEKNQDTSFTVDETNKESRTFDTEEDFKRQYEEDRFKGVRDKTESKDGKFNDSVDVLGNKSKEPETTNMLPKKPTSAIEALKKDKKSVIQDEPKPIRSSDHLRQKLLALERELSVESIESKTVGIFFPNERRRSIGTEKETSEQTINPDRKGISHKMAIIFIVAAATGSAFEALPYHLRESTWFGVFFFLLLGLNSLYSCLCTGWCWSLMEEIWPEYLVWSRVPYQTIAYRAVGTWMKYIVAVLVDATIFIMCGNYIISVSETIGGFLYPHITACYFILIATAVMLVFSMFGSYRNIKFLGAGDVILSLLFILFIVIILFCDHNKHGSRDYTQSPHESIVMAFAGMSYAYGIGIIMPNIVLEMENRSKFTETCVTAYMIVLSMYTVIAILGYAAYGNKTPEHITKFALESESLKTFGVFIDVLQAVQLLTTFVIYFIPLALAAEEIMDCPDRFCSRRVTIRGIIIVAIMVIVLGLPRIVIHMNIVAATSLNILSFILPPLFYVCLINKEKAKKLRSKMSLKELFLVAEIVILGIVIAIMAIYISFTKAFHLENDYVSCYLNMSLFPLK